MDFLNKKMGIDGQQGEEPSLLQKIKERFQNNKEGMGNFGSKLAESLQRPTVDTSKIYEGAIQRAAAARRPIYGATMLSDENAKTNIKKEGLADALMKSRQDLAKPRRRKK